MKRFLTTLRRDGSFDFYSSLIEIEKYDAREKNQLEAILCASPESLSEGWQADALSLFVHEYTHYLDVTCTTWGLEFLLRKNNVLKSLDDSNALEKYSPVFMLNLAEIELHSKLLEIHRQDIKLTDCRTEHAALYSDVYGPIIVVYFTKGSERFLSTPLSMLSVLESNAYASEILCKIRFFEATNDVDGLLLLEREVNDYLNSPQLSEYSLPLILCKKHFEYLSLKECLIFYQSLVWRILNMNGLNLSIISAFLKHTFRNKYVGNAICKDLQRGMSRQVVVFKLILMLHQFINESKDKHELIGLLKSDPKKILSVFFEENDISVVDSLDVGEWGEFTVHLDTVRNCSKFQEKEFVSGSARHNHQKLQGSNWGEVSLTDFVLPDALLSDGTVLSAPSRIDLDVVDYFDRHLDQMIKVENIYKATDVSKFHIHPDDVSHV
ncbi:hypothetical protein [Microbulbifer thermotolerans]|uniref:hypothetical protein n=1 Tax=Microbulbifer thermotolerans TaxID=252514 RepID=UPI00224A9357|nr:hypothetical protein [Microbulbifer thermotolerans]MCX2780606.1 hypothetical protein [Microbulbifer thermotolerans]MCX2806147.1 hypothetical protein [Microbulbifer thermotolerans]